MAKGLHPILNLTEFETLEDLLQWLGEKIKNQIEEVIPEIEIYVCEDGVGAYQEYGDVDGVLVWEKFSEHVRLDTVDEAEKAVAGLREAANRIEGLIPMISKRISEEEERLRLYRIARKAEEKQRADDALMASDYLSDRTLAIIEVSGPWSKGALRRAVESGSLDPNKEYRYGGIPDYDQECHDEILKWLKATN